MGMNRVLFGFFIVGILAGCKDGCGERVIKDYGADSNRSVLDSSNPTAVDRIKMDSIVPEDPKKAEQLSGFERDSFLMRIRFQKAANDMMDAYKKGDLDRFVGYILPSVIKAMGGAEKQKEKYKLMMKERPKFDKLLTGPVSVLGEVEDLKGKSAGWYCLMPQLSTITENGKKIQIEGMFAGHSPDGKKCYFVEITSMPDNMVFYLMPDLYHVVPELPQRGQRYIIP